MKEETIEEIFVKMLASVEKRFESLSEYIKQEMSKGYITPFENKYAEDNDSVAFKIGQRKFLLVASIIPQTRYTYLKTYELVRANASYPNWCLHHVNEMDIMVGMYNSSPEFLEEKEFSEKAAIGEPNKWKSKIINKFNEDYFYQLAKWIVNHV